VRDGSGSTDALVESCRYRIPFDPVPRENEARDAHAGGRGRRTSRLRARVRRAKDRGVSATCHGEDGSKLSASFEPNQRRQGSMLVERLRLRCRRLRWPEATRLDGTSEFAALPPSRFVLWRDQSSPKATTWQASRCVKEARICCCWKEPVGMRRRPASRDYGVTWPVEDRKKLSLPACEAGCSTPRRPQSG